MEPDTEAISTPLPPPPDTKHLTWLASGVALGLFVGFLIGRGTRSAEPVSTPPPEAPAASAPAPTAAAPAPATAPAAAAAPEPTPPPPPPAPPSNLSLRLLGTFMDSPTAGVALIENPATGKQSIYEVGDLVAAGVTIERITHDRVILLRGGNREELRLTKPQ